MGSETRYLVKQHNTWSVVVEVPRKLQGIIGCKRLKKTLGTDSLKAANRLKGRFVSEFKDRIEHASVLAGNSDPLVRKALADREALRLAREHPPAWTSGLENHEAEPIEQLVLAEILDEARTMHLDGHPADARRYVSLAANNKSARLRDLADAWLKQRVGEIGIAAHSQQASIIKTFIEWAGINVLASEVDRAMAGSYVDWLRSPASGRKPSTMRRHVFALHKFWVWLESGQRGGVTSNPWSRQDLGKMASAPLMPFPDELLVRLLSGTANDTMHDMMRLALMTGARSRAIASLTGQDLTEKPDGLWARFSSDKTAAGKREIAVHNAAAPILRRRAKIAEGGPLFPEMYVDREGKRGSSNTHAFRKYRCSLGIEGYKFHSFRATFVQAMLKAGVPLHLVQLYAGHAVKSVAGAATASYMHGIMGDHGLDWRAIINKLSYAPAIMKLVANSPI
jgi:integrase